MYYYRVMDDKNMQSISYHVPDCETIVNNFVRGILGQVTQLIPLGLTNWLKTQKKLQELVGNIDLNDSDIEITNVMMNFLQ